MRIQQGLAVVIALVILLSASIVADETACDRGDCNSGGAPAQSSTTLSFPINTLAEIAAMLLGRPIHLAVGLAIPDLEVTFRKAIEGNPQPWVDCGKLCCDAEGTLRMWTDLVLHGGAAASDPFANALSATLRISGSPIADDSSGDHEQDLACYIREWIHVKNGSASAALVFPGGINIPLSRSDDVELAPGIEFEMQSSCGQVRNRPPDISVPVQPVKVPIGGSVDVAISAVDTDGDDVHVWVHGSGDAKATLYYSEQTKQPMVHIELDASVQGGTTLSVGVDAYDLLAGEAGPFSGRLQLSERGEVYHHQVAKTFEIEAVAAEAPTTPTVSVQYPKTMREARIDLTITNPGMMLTDLTWHNLPDWVETEFKYPCADPLVWWECYGKITDHIDEFSTWIKVSPEDMRIGRHILSYQVGNSIGLRSIGTVDIEVLNTPPVAKDDAVTLQTNAAGASRSINCEVLKNDRDPDGVGFVAIQVVEGKGPYHGAVKIEDDLTITYTSNEGHGGVDTFTYRVSDVPGALSENDEDWSNVATVTVTTSTPPVALDTTVRGHPDVWNPLPPDKPTDWWLNLENLS